MGFSTGFLGAMDVYFGGEKAAAIGAVVFGLVCLGVGFYLWRSVGGGIGGGLGAGMGIPLLLIGLGAAGGGVGLHRTVSNRGAQLTQDFERDAEAPVRAERARMVKVNKNWLPLKIAWTVIIGLALFALLRSSPDWLTGVALTLLVVMAMVMVFDVFAERRALLYTERLEGVLSANPSDVSSAEP